MTAARKINLLVLAIALVSGALVTTYTLLQEYGAVRDRVIADASARIEGQPHLQVDIYFQDRASLRESLDRLLQLPALRYGAVFTAGGDVLAIHQQSDVQSYTPPDFPTARAGSREVEPALASHAARAPQSARFLATLIGGETLLEYNQPVFATLNPTRENLTRLAFGQALVEPDNVGSLHVIGYVHLGISRTLLVKQALPRAGTAALISLAITAVFVLVSYLISRRITRPLSELVQISQDVAAGRVTDNIRIRNAGELREIVAVMNTIISGLDTYKTRLNVDKALLTLKVNERTQQLSPREEQLTQVSREVSETKDRLRQVAYFDTLTELPNRRLFSEQLRLLLSLAKRNGSTLALMYLDLDDFKRINDSLGHSAGDDLLREIGRRINACVRESDVVAHYTTDEDRVDVSRLGGDEFTVILNEIDSADAAALVAKRIQGAISQPLTLRGHELVVTSSVGIAIAPRDAADTEDLQKAADTAMYHAKRAGKNRYLYYDSEMQAVGMERLRIEADLRSFQPLLPEHLEPAEPVRSESVEYLP